MSQMKHVVIALVTYVAAVAQTSFRPEMAVGHFEPDFLVLALLFVVFQFDGIEAVFWAAGIGLISDCLTPDRLGIGMFAATSLAIVIRQSQSASRQRTPLPTSFVWIPSILAILLATTVLRNLTSEHPSPFTVQMILVAGNTVYTILTGLSSLLIWHIALRLFPRIQTESSKPLTNRWKMLTP